MWEPSQETQANAEGWRLVTTFELNDTHPLWDIAKHGPKFTDDRHASLAVIDAAKRGGALHQHALKLVTQSRARPPKGTQ